MRWTGHVVCWGVRNSNKIVIQKPHEKRTISRWEGNINTDKQIKIFEGVDSIHLAQGGGILWARYENSGFIEDGECLDQLNDYYRHSKNSALWSYLESLYNSVCSLIYYQ
jgi:hypothetical protein